MARTFPKRQGGLCWNETRRRWERCSNVQGNAPTPAFNNGGEETLNCCLGSNCCLTCEQLDDLRRCILTNWQASAALGLTVGNLTPDLSRLIQLWQVPALLNLPNSCRQYLPSNPFDNSFVGPDNQVISCYSIETAINSGITIYDGMQLPIGLYFKNTDTNCRYNFAIFGLFQFTQVDIADFRFDVLGAKACINYFNIFTVENYRKLCEDCFNKVCHFIVGIGTEVGAIININLNDFFPVIEPNRLYQIPATITIPTCCGVKVDKSHYILTNNNGTIDVNLSMPAFIGFGIYNFDIFITPTNPGPGQATVVVKRPGCGEAIINISFNVNG